MRSRYSAYVLGNEAYLLATWHPDTRPAVLDLADDAPVKWLVSPLGWGPAVSLYSNRAK